MLGYLVTGNLLNINKHGLVHPSTAWSYQGLHYPWSYLGTINQHDHALHNINNAWSFIIMLGHASLSRLITNMTMFFIVRLGHVSFSGIRPLGPGCVSGQDTLLKIAQ